MLLLRFSLVFFPSLNDSLVDSANLALSRFPSSSTKDNLSCLLPMSRPSPPMLTLRSSIHSMRLVGSLVRSRRSSRLVSSETGSLLGNSSSVYLRTSMSLGMVVDSNGQNP